MTNTHDCICPSGRAGVNCEELGPKRVDPPPTPPQDPLHATMSVILAAVIVFFLCLVVIVVYCTSEQRRKTKRKQAKRLSRDEGKRTSSNHERNNRENEIITENPNRFKPDNQTTRNINGRYNGSNHESISLLNVSQITHPLNTPGSIVPSEVELVTDQLCLGIVMYNPILKNFEVFSFTISYPPNI